MQMHFLFTHAPQGPHSLWDLHEFPAGQLGSGQVGQSQGQVSFSAPQSANLRVPLETQPASWQLSDPVLHDSPALPSHSRVLPSVQNTLA